VITLLQLSVAVALPVFVVAVSMVQVGLSYTVIGAGQVITGRIVSKIVITWIQGLLVLPQLSVAVQVRLIV
jgi:hypothetical protein